MKLFAFERRWVPAVMGAFAPPENPGFSPREGEVDYLHAFVSMADWSTPLARFGLRAALWVVALSPVLLFFRFRTFGSMSVAERTEALSRLLAHRVYMVRELCFYLKLTTCMALFAHPEARARTGYDRLRSAVTPTAPRAVRLPLLAESA